SLCGQRRSETAWAVEPRVLDGSSILDPMPSREAARKHSVLEAALSLPPAEREAVALELLESVAGDPGFLESPEWQEELARRVADIQRGDVQLVDWDDVRRKFRTG